MRRLFAVLLLPAAVASSAMAGGCSSSDNGAADASIDGFGVIVGGDDGGGDGAGGGDGGTTSWQSTLRLAHASPDLGPVDFCWRAHGTQAFTGPVLGAAALQGDASSGNDGAFDAGATDEVSTGDAASAADATSATDADAAAESDAALGADAADGDAAGPPTSGALVFGEMTPAVQLPNAGTFDLALVAPGQSSCYAAYLGGQVTLYANQSTTAVIMGLVGQEAGPSVLSFVPFTDAPFDQQSARVRLIHAALGSRSESAAPSLSVRAGTTVLAAEIDPTKATTSSAAPAVDALGYATVQPLDGPASLQIVTVGDVALTTWSTQADSDLHVQVGTAHTGILVSLDHGELGVAWCSDAPTAGAPECRLLAAAP
jgi:hypothetical protein